MSGSANLANYSVLVTSWLPEENLQLLISKPAEALTTTYKRLSSYTQISVVFSSLQGKFSMQQTETMTESHNQSKHQVVTCLFTFNLFFHFFFFLSFLQCFTSSSLLFFLSFLIQGLMQIKGAQYCGFPVSVLQGLGLHVCSSHLVVYTFLMNSLNIVFTILMGSNLFLLTNVLLIFYSRIFISISVAFCNLLKIVQALFK